MINNLNMIKEIKKQDIPDPNIQEIIKKYEKISKDEDFGIEI